MDCNKELKQMVQVILANTPYGDPPFYYWRGKHNPPAGPRPETVPGASYGLCTRYNTSSGQLDTRYMPAMQCVMEGGHIPLAYLRNPAYP